jgi:hypothetical protein
MQPWTRPVRADDLASATVWQATHAGATVVWEERADEGHGHGFDNLDPSPMVRAMYQVDADWTAVLDGYRRRLADDGWAERQVRDIWWQWSRQRNGAERIDVIHRLPGFGRFWPSSIRQGTTVFEVNYTVNPDA